MATAKKATARATVKTVSAAMLAKSIDGAILKAAVRFQVPVAGPTLSLKWEIVGRILRDMDATHALGIAEEVTKSVNKLSGIDAQAAISRINGGILVGFIERAQLPRTFGS